MLKALDKGARCCALMEFDSHLPTRQFGTISSALSPRAPGGAPRLAHEFDLVRNFLLLFLCASLDTGPGYWCLGIHPREDLRMTDYSSWDYSLLAIIIFICGVYIVRRALHMFSKNGGSCGSCCSGGDGCGGAESEKKDSLI